MIRRGNQFIIKINKNYIGVEDYYALIDACHELNGVALKLYIYLNGFAPYEEIAFSPQLFCYEMNVSASATHKAFNELLEKKYIKAIENNYYEFAPQKVIKEMTN